jgi:hypothetical protein
MATLKKKTPFVNLQYHISFSVIVSLNGVKEAKLKVKFSLEQAPKVHRGSRGIVLLFL